MMEPSLLPAMLMLLIGSFNGLVVAPVSQMPHAVQYNMSHDTNQWAGTHIRAANQILDANDDDRGVAKAYAAWGDKGVVVDGRRITIMTGKQSYRAGEEIRVVHIAEAVSSGHRVYIMGPKEILDESVNGSFHGDTVRTGDIDPFTPNTYDGRVLDGPAIDNNYAVTTYSFAQPGTYLICWQPGAWRSNVLRIDVTK